MACLATFVPPAQTHHLPLSTVCAAPVRSCLQQQACPVGCVGCQCRATLVCFACRYFGLSFLLYYCLATPLLYKGYNFFNARGLWFISTTQQNLWHTFFGSMVSLVCR